MDEPSDLDLLRRYASERDEQSFALLVERHADWLFAAAKRRLGDDHLADDATQAVFLVLSEKANDLVAGEPRSLGAWLFHVMHFACERTRRSRSRRQHHELHATALRNAERDSLVQPDDRLLALLEDAIAQLAEIDRETVVRRFYRRQDFASIGAALDMSAEAARKHVTRSLAKLRTLIVRDGIDAVTDALLGAMAHEIPSAPRTAQSAVDQQRIRDLAKGTVTMAQEAQDLGFPVVSAEFFVKDVEANLDFFEKLGFARRWSEIPDPMGRITRASLRGGVGRIWLRRASEDEGTRPTPGMILFFWIDNPDALVAHRNRIAAAGVEVSAFHNLHALRDFTVTSPDGYTIGFFTQYKD